MLRSRAFVRPTHGAYEAAGERSSAIRVTTNDLPLAAAGSPSSVSGIAEHG